jgi:hypothetical protein
MNNRFHIVILVTMLFPTVLISGQDNQTVITGDQSNTVEGEKKTLIYGFVRGGLYGGIDQNDDKPYISSAFSDLGLKVESGNNLNFKVFADLRFRFGSEFQEPVNRIDLREAYITLNGEKWDIDAGQKIIKWGRADFTNPTSKLSPRNYISRSPDAEDMDMGNLLVSGRWFPVPKISLEAVAIPFFRSSRLLIDPIALPSYVTLNHTETLVTEKDMFSYGVKTDAHLQGIDMSISYFDGYDPMPGTALTNFNLDMSGPYPVPFTELTMKQYKIRNIGFDFETTLGSTGIRGEASWRMPYKSYKTNEYVPCQELTWVTGIDYTSGNWRFTGEYSGKYLLDYIPVSVDPFIGTEPDYAALAVLMMTPGFIMEDYVRAQVGSFNRLYNYQIERYYHSAGLRIETDLIYGKLTPSFFTMYNFTSHDFMMMPGLKFKPADGLCISVGGEYYSGRKGSIYDIIDEFMNCITVAIRVDF